MAINKKIIFLLLALIIFVKLTLAQEIHEAVQQGDLERVRKLVEENAEWIHHRTTEGDTPLYSCAAYGHIKIAEFLIEKGANINVQNNQGWTPLSVASFNGHFEIVELLLKHGADVNAKDIYGSSALNRSVGRGHLDISEFLIRNGADPNIQNPLGITPLFWAVRSGNREMVTLLLSHGGDLNGVMNDGTTLLHLAASLGENDICEYLISKGMDVNIKKRYDVTPLHLATVFGHKDIVEMLIDHGADIHSLSEFAGLPIHQAMASGHDQVVQLLLAKGAKNRKRIFPELGGSYLGMKRPGATPEIFAPGILIHVHWPHTRLLFTEDGTEVFWSAASFYGNQERIWFMKQENGRWQPPQIAPFSIPGPHIDGGPFLSPDGKRLYFQSTRPMENNVKPKAPGFWYVERQEKGWSKPKHVSLPINANAMIGFGYFSKNGTLFFHGSGIEGGYGSGDIYKAEFRNGEFMKPENLGEIINSKYADVHPYIAPDESYILFQSNRSGGQSPEFELYISFKNKDNLWTEPKNLGKTINVGRTTAPYISPDGKYLFFINARHGSRDYYWVDAKIIEKLKPEELK